MSVLQSFMTSFGAKVFGSLFIKGIEEYKEHLRNKSRTIVFNDKGELLHKHIAFKRIDKLVAKNKINELIVKVKSNKKLLRKLDDAQKRDMIDLYERKESQLRKIFILIYGEQFRKMLPPFSMTKVVYRKMINDSIRLLPNIQEESNISDDEILISCILDKKDFNFNVPIKKECIKNYKSDGLVVHDIKNEEWIRGIFIPYLVVSIAKTKTQDEIDQFDLEYYYNLFNWKIGLA